MRSKAIKVDVCDWESRQPVVGDELTRGVVPAAIPAVVRKRRAHACCSPQLPPDPDLGTVRYIAPHTRGGDCFGRDQLAVTPVGQMEF